MSLKVIKYVAGGGKTTDAIYFMKTNTNSIYLAFNNKVVKEVESKGLLSKTIDSLFVSYILPKIKSIIPLISKINKISYCDSNALPKIYRGVGNLKIDNEGNICNKKKKTFINLNDSIEKLDINENFPNKKLIKFLLKNDELKLTNELRNNLFDYILNKDPLKVCEIMSTKFSYIIVDEAQDLKKHQEKFIKLLSTSCINVILYGDDFQNINGGGKWFANLNADLNINYSKRCPEENCKWIRENLDIKIFGRIDLTGKIEKISLMNALDYNDGNKVLLYNSKYKDISEIIKNWKGEKYTIKKAKGMTIVKDIVVIGKELNIKNTYTAITRTTGKVYMTTDVVKK